MRTSTRRQFFCTVTCYRDVLLDHTGNAPARISKLNGNKSSFRIGKGLLLSFSDTCTLNSVSPRAGTFEHQDNEQATAAAAAAAAADAIRSGSLPALVTVYLILQYVML